MKQFLITHIILDLDVQLSQYQFTERRIVLQSMSTIKNEEPQKTSFTITAIAGEKVSALHKLPGDYCVTPYFWCLHVTYRQ